VHGFTTDNNDHCVFSRDSRREVMIFFEKNKVLGVEADNALKVSGHALFTSTSNY
jgi:hypothetical protein